MTDSEHATRKDSDEAPKLSFGRKWDYAAAPQATLKPTPQPQPQPQPPQPRPGPPPAASAPPPAR